MAHQQTIQQNIILAFLLLIFAAKFMRSATDPALKGCMEEPQDVSDSSYSTALAYFQRCLDLGKNTSREELPEGYFNKVVENMRQSFEDFLEDSGLGEEQLAAIRKEIRALSGEIRHVPRKKNFLSVPKNASPLNGTDRVPGKTASKEQSKMLDNITAQADQPEGTLHLEFVNNIWPHQMYNVFPPDDQKSAEPAAPAAAEESLAPENGGTNTTNSSLHNQLKKCGSNKNTNGVEVLTLFLCFVTLAVCCWMAYKIYCQYQLWARVRYEASNHKTETTPLNRSESCISSKNVCNEEKKETGSKRGFLP